MHQQDQTIKETLRLLRSQSERLEAAIRELKVQHMVSGDVGEHDGGVGRNDQLD